MTTATARMQAILDRLIATQQREDELAAGFPALLAQFKAYEKACDDLDASLAHVPDDWADDE